MADNISASIVEHGENIAEASTPYTKDVRYAPVAYASRE